MNKTQKKYTWIIDSTGSNTVGTTFTNDVTEFLYNKGFTKMLKGNPLYATEINYSNDEVNEICQHIMNMRKNYGQHIEKIKCLYFKTENVSFIEYSGDEVDKYKLNNYIKHS